MRTFSAVRPLLVAATFLLGGCLSLVIPEHAPATTDDATVEAMLMQQDFLGPGFVKINHAPFTSDLEPDRVVTMYVSAAAAAAYEAVTPDADTAGAAFPVGGMIVRTSTDMNGTLQALSFMVKREPGYFPEVGDFLFGVADPQGTPEVADDGTTMMGKLNDCAQCHETRSTAGFLFGVATAHR
jgi:hypothetical protein